MGRLIRPLGVASLGLGAVAALGVIRARGRRREALRVRASVTVDRAPEEAYRFWRDLENLPSFMYHLESVRATGQGGSHWTARAPGRRSVEWDAELVEDRPRQLIAWRSVDGADVKNSGQVSFAPAPGGRGTEVRVELDFSPPAGRLGAAVAKLFGEHPYQQARDDLRRFKQVIETGEVTRSDASPDGLNARRQLAQRPGRPRQGTGRREVR
ncbi:SRPBCC family protein [Rugosimonospora acidiphila]|uniref:SRPBCC family protein n=1 Tax=Rugosimonospora acidiphila TaxID=556531 RepID=UPI0031E83438